MMIMMMMMRVLSSVLMILVMMEMDDEKSYVQKLCRNNSHSFGCDFDLTVTSGQLNRQGEKRTYPVARLQRKLSFGV